MTSKTGRFFSGVPFLRLYRTHIAVSAFLSALVIFYHVQDPEVQAVETARIGAPGGLIDGAYGKTYYEVTGPNSRETVVLIHGFSAASFVWDKNVGVLGRGGFKTVRYDLFGRGYSDRPDAEYDDDLYDRQLLDLIQGLRLRAPVNVVGLSMGGRIAATFADRHPGLVRRLILVDCAGFDMQIPAAAYIMHVPGVGEYLAAVLSKKLIQGRLPENFHQPGQHQEFYAKFEPQTRWKGYRRAILSSTRNMLGSVNDLYERVGRTNLPVLIVWGKHDRVIPLDRGERLKTVMPRAQFKIIDATGHLPQYEAPGDFNRVVMKFLSGAP